MTPSTKFVLSIKTNSEEEKARIGAAIHEQLKGNPAYVDSRIILNIEDECLVKLIIFDDTEIKQIPNINIPFQNPEDVGPFFG